MGRGGGREGVFFVQSRDGGLEGGFGARDERAAVRVAGEEVRDGEADAAGAAGDEDVGGGHGGGCVVWIMGGAYLVGLRGWTSFRGEYGNWRARSKR